MYYYQPIIPNIKRYEKIMNLTTSQNKGYNTGCLLDYDNVMIMISRQKELRQFSKQNSLND